MPKKNKKSSRLSWDEYFINLTHAIAERGTCDRGKSGCVIVKEKRLLTTGYVGSPSGMPHCDQAGHLMHQVVNEDGTISQHCIRTTHAEQNALVQAAKFGISVDGATLYCKMEPCFVCAKMIASVGIKRVVSERRYHAAKLTRELFRRAGVKLDVVEDKVETYENM